MDRQVGDGMKGIPRLRASAAEVIARHCAPASASVIVAAPVALSAQIRGHSKLIGGASLQLLGRQTGEKRGIRQGKMATIQRFLARL